MTRLRFLCESVVTYAVLGPMLLPVFVAAGSPWSFSEAVTHQGLGNVILTLLWGLVFLPVALWRFGIGAGLLGGGLCLLLIELGIPKRPLVLFASLGAVIGAGLGLLLSELLVASGPGLGSSPSVVVRGAAMLSGGVCGSIVARLGWQAAQHAADGASRRS